tara:strand:+ start:121 stop:1530 length:1410 start_codon:yes stop_codon:yes gene_type:complete
MAVTAVDPSSTLGQAMGTTAASNNFNKLDFYLVKNEVALFPKWNVYDSMYGSIKWEPNMGDTLQGLTPTPSPVSRSTFAPNVLADAPLKDIYKVGERNESAKLSYHRYESTRFRFLNSFEAFWRDQLSYAHADIVRQIQNANNQFVRTLMYYQTPDVYIAQDGAGDLASSLTLQDSAAVGALTQDQIRTIDGDDDSTSGASAAVSQKKGQIFRRAISIGATASANRAGALTLKDLYKAMLVLQEDVQAPTFDRQFGVPKTSEMIKGKYVLVCSTEAWASLLWDDDLKKHGTGQALASTSRDFLKDGFAGDLFGKITVKFDPYPLRFTDLATTGGDFVAPQAVSGNKVVPNSNYTKISATASNSIASNEVAFLCGADAFKTISVGPPPREFAGKNISKKKLYGMNWNGQIDLTDQFLVPTADTTDVTNDTSWDLNVYGDYLKFISQTIHGGIPGDARHCLPIIFRRRRTS